VGKDLMHSAQLKELVRSAYSGIDADTSTVARKIYTEGQLERVPRSVMERALGVGNHLAHADIEPGDVVLDLGCGGGIDSILAAHEVGPTGRVMALDFLPEMLERTDEAARLAGLDNVETIEGEMEQIPLPTASVDHIISNGVINLSPRKMRVLSECARVLRPGGRFCASDLTVDQGALPTEVLTHPAAWAG
jgi:arsenite methyltransferase